MKINRQTLSELVADVIREEMVNLIKEESVIREASAGDRMKRYRERLDKLKDKMADTKSQTLKAKYQSTMKNILQRMSDIKKAHGVKSSFK
jgi:hypothetical protein